MPLKLAVAGLLVGMLSGATGVGGGSLMTPLLVLLFGYSPTVAVGTDIVHGAIFKSFGAVVHRRLGTVQARLSGWMLIGSAPASLGGVALSTWLRHRYGDNTGVTKEILGVALIAGGFGIAAKMLVAPRETEPPDFQLTRRSRITAIVIGLVGGFVVGLTSIGTGVFFGLTMLIAFPLRSSKVVGTDLFHAAALLWVAGMGHLVAGNVAVGTVGWLLIGSIPGVLIGARMSVRLSDRLLRLVLAATLTASGIVLAGWMVAGLGSVVPAVVFVVVLVRSRAAVATAVASASRSTAS
jgi:uncharacterized protein